ncbi:MAG: hypothetical protein ACXAD7_12360 [Candidatus Kariarchaeaceae archaeon]
MNDPEKSADVKEAVKKGGKEILFGFSKAGMVFTKRVAEGALSAQLAQNQETDTIEKIKAASSELGRAVIKGVVEGATETFEGILTGVGTVSEALNKKKSADTDEIE